MNLALRRRQRPSTQSLDDRAFDHVNYVLGLRNRGVGLLGTDHRLAVVGVGFRPVSSTQLPSDIVADHRCRVRELREPRAQTCMGLRGRDPSLLQRRPRSVVSP